MQRHFFLTLSTSSTVLLVSVRCAFWSMDWNSVSIYAIRLARTPQKISFPDFDQVCDSVKIAMIEVLSITNHPSIHPSSKPREKNNDASLTNNNTTTKICQPTFVYFPKNILWLIVSDPFLPSFTSQCHNIL